MTPGIQVFVYPEELCHTSPESLVETILGLGCDAVAMALVYHRARRVLPRHGSISVLATNGVYFEPDASRYRALAPVATAPLELRDALMRFRDVCGREGLRFRAWLVGLHDESLAAACPGAASRALDGSPLGHSLCPSAAESIEYVAAVAGDVAHRFAPDSVDLEAWLYPAWEPAYTLTLALEPLSPTAELLATQCFCAACRTLMGGAAEELELRARRAAGHPFGEPSGDAEIVAELASRRSAGATRLATAVAETVHAAGASLRLLCAGREDQLALQGLSPASVAAADGVSVGGARLHGAKLVARFDEVRKLVAGGARAVSVSTNWTPERTPRSMADDVTALAAHGADGLSLYNLSLVPDAGLEAFRAAAAAFRAAVSSPRAPLATR